MARVYIDFYEQLISSDIFSKEQKLYITKTFNKVKADYKKKIRERTLLCPTSGRPKKISNMIYFNIMATFYKQGNCSLPLMLKIFRVSRGTLFRYLRESEPVKLPKTIQSKEVIDKLKELYNTYAFEYARYYTKKLWSKKYEDDLYQECLVEMYANLFNYDGTMNFKAFCFNICEQCLQKYIEISGNENGEIHYQQSEVLTGRGVF